MALGLGALGLAPAAFWSMTPREFAAVVRWRQPAGASTPTRHEFDALMTAFPDR